MATIIKILRVDMRANDPKVIQGELQEQVDAIGKEGYKIVGQVYPLPSPNTALQYFIITCDGYKKKEIKEEIKEE